MLQFLGRVSHIPGWSWIRHVELELLILLFLSPDLVLGLQMWATTPTLSGTARQALYQVSYRTSPFCLHSYLWGLWGCSAHCSHNVYKIMCLLMEYSHKHRWGKTVIASWACHPSSGEAEAGDGNKCKVSLGYRVRPWLKTPKTKLQTVTNIFSRRRVWGKAGWGAFLKAMLLSGHVGDIPVSCSGKIWKKALWHTRAVPACLWCQSEVEMLVITLCSQRAWDGYTAQRLAHRALFLLGSQRTTCGCWFFLPCGSRDYT